MFNSIPILYGTDQFYTIFFYRLQSIRKAIKGLFHTCGNLFLSSKLNGPTQCTMEIIFIVIFIIDVIYQITIIRWR